MTTNTDEILEKPHWIFYFAMFGSMLLAMGVYIGIYYLNTLHTATVSFYYLNNFTPAPNSLGANNGTATTLSLSKDAPTIIKTIGFGWLMWKLANCIYIIDVVYKLGWVRKLIGVIVMVLCMLALDILLTVFTPQAYTEWMFVCGVAGLTIILGFMLTIKSEMKYVWHQILRNALLPFFGYSLLIAVYWLAIP
jgi:hypothetical protein